MKIIRPIVMTDDTLTSSTVTEADYVAYSLAATYAPEDRCIVTTPNVHMIYEAIENVGIETLTIDVSPTEDWEEGNTIKGATSNATCVVIEKLTATTYLIKDRSGAFTLGEIIGVEFITDKLADQGAAHPTFATAANLDRDPTVDVERDVPAFWKEVSATNRWKCFDDKVGTQTEKADVLEYVITPGEIVDSIGFINVEAISIDIVVDDPVEGEVYNETIDLQTTLIAGSESVYDWYSYFFSSITLISDYAVLDIPPYLNAVFTITITYTSGTVKIGAIVLGRQATIGTLMRNPTIGIKDYSRKEADEYGVYSITQGEFSKKLNCFVKIPNSTLDDVVRLFALYRSTILVWVASTDFTCLIIYGIYKDFNVLLPSNVDSECTLELEGLT